MRWDLHQVALAHADGDVVAEEKQNALVVAPGKNARRVFLRRDGSGLPWTWSWAFRWVLPRLLSIFVMGALAFRRYGLSWAGVAVVLACSVVGGLLFVGYELWHGWRRPIDLLSGRTKFVEQGNQHHEFRCQRCGWHGSVSALDRTVGDQGLLELDCPECGSAVLRMKSLGHAT